MPTTDAQDWRPGQPAGTRAPGETSPVESLGPAATTDFVPPLDRSSPQFTVRAVLTGALLGAILAICNVHVGLKVGIMPNMSIAAALLGFGFWTGARYISGKRVAGLGILENNISQTIGSSGALVAGAGLAAPIPALAMLTGQSLPWHWLALWMFSVMLVGIAVAIPLRRQFVLTDKLPFPSGVATAATLREIHARGTAAARRAVALGSAAMVGAIVSVVQELPSFSALSKLSITRLARYVQPYPLPFSIRGIPAGALTFSLTPSAALVGIGGLVGFRTTATMLVGALLAYLVAVPPLIESHFIKTAADLPRFPEINGWLLWPGVALMVVGSLVPMLFAWRAMRGAWSAWTQRAPGTAAPEAGDIPRSWVRLLLLFVLILSVVLQVTFFHIPWPAAVIAVLLTFLLASAAARVNGQTGVNLIGPMGKVTQLTFGVLVPRSPVPNLMAANVTGGAATQCADLLDDLKCGHLLGASPKWLGLSQIVGALVGALVGSEAYLLLVQRIGQLPNEQWPATAAVIWKAVAQTLATGFDSLPRGATTAVMLAAAFAIVIPVLERFLPARGRVWLPSPIALGLGCVLPAGFTMSLFAGGLLAGIMQRWFPDWSNRFRIVICAGLIAGESLAGVVAAVIHLWYG